MDDIREKLKWLLERRFGCKDIIEVQIPPANVTAFSLTDAATQRFFATVVDTIKVRSVETLARNLAMYVNDPAATVEYLIVYREKCTQTASQQHRARIFHNTEENQARIICHVFSQESICSHPLQFSIVPQDYRVVAEGTAKHAELLKLTNGNLTQLPWMRETDKVARLLGFQAGQVIAHTEALGILPPTIVYRIMVPADTNA